MVSTPDSGYQGNLTPEELFGEYNQMLFVIRQVLGKQFTITLAKVTAVTNNGTDAAVGYVDVQPLVNQVDGAGKSIPFPLLNNLPYFRLQGGSNAVILDPQVGDIGLVAFADRDISQVKNTKKQANPGSSRRFDMSDGLYMGGVLNGVPTQYVQFQDTGITVKSPQAVTIDAPTTSITGDTNIAGTLTLAGIDMNTHTHSDPQGGNTGGPQ